MRYNGAGRPVRVPPFLDEIVNEDLSHAPGGPSWFEINLWDLKNGERERAGREWWGATQGGMGPRVIMFGVREADLVIHSPPSGQKRAERPDIAPGMGRR